MDHYLKPDKLEIILDVIIKDSFLISHICFHLSCAAAFYWLAFHFIMEAIKETIFFSGDNANSK